MYVCVSILNYPDCSAAFPPHLLKQLRRARRLSNPVFLTVLTCPLPRVGGAVRCVVPAPVGRGQVLGRWPWRFALRRPPSHEGLLCVPAALLEGVHGAAPGSQTAHSWIPQRIIMEANLPAEKYAAHATYK